MSMKKEIEKELEHFISKIENYYNINCVILFGSQARGDYLPYSDIDLIIIADFKDEFFKRSLKLMLLNESRYNFELFCYTGEEFEMMFVKGNALIYDAIYEGKPLTGSHFFNKYKKRMNQMIQKGLSRSNCSWVLI